MRRLAAFLLYALIPAQALAQDGVRPDSMIEGAKLCTRHFPRLEREYAIPTHLLAAIASTESGRFHDGLKLRLPWPWTINAGGKGHFFDSKREAVAAVKHLRAQGVQNIDVGCMQVNLHHHPHAFASLEEAFEPQNNVAYAAGFLRTLFNESGVWKTAAAHYHSRTPSLGQNYVGSVYHSWYSIIEKLRTARLQVPESSVAAMNDLKSPLPDGPYSPASKTVRVAAAQPASSVKLLSGQQGRKLPPQETPRMNSIQVTTVSAGEAAEKRTERARSLIIIPTHSAVVASPDAPPEAQAAASAAAPAALAPAAAAPAAADAKPAAAATAQPIQQANAAHSPALATPRKNGPQFIFSD